MKKGLICLSVILLVFITTGCTKKALLELESNASTGYEWSCVVNDTEYAKIVDEEYVASSDTSIVGAPGKQIFKFKGIKAGTTTASCKYQRSFEELPIQVKNYTLVVDEKLNITIQEITM